MLGAWLLVGPVAKDVVLLALHLGKVKVCASHTLVDVLDVIAGGLEVSRGIIGTRDEDLEPNKYHKEFINLRRSSH